MTSLSSQSRFPARPPGRPLALRWTRAVSVIALLLALVASVALLFLPVYSTDSMPGGAGQATLLGHNGPWVLVPLTVPVLLAAMIALTSTRGRVAAALVVVCAVLLLAFAAVWLPSIGMFYLPAALVALVAAVARAGALLLAAGRRRRARG